MNNIKFNLLSKIILTVGVAILVYGIIVPIIPIYLFWESKYIGWVAIFIALISFLNHNRGIRKKEGKKSILIIFGMSITLLILFIQLLLITILPFTDAYNAAEDYIKNDDLLTTELGNIESICLFPIGNLKKTSNLEGVRGVATIKFLIKGEQKYKIVEIHLNKEVNTDWLIDKVNN